MEAIKNNKTNERVNNRVNNRIAFDYGERRPEYAILLPNGHSVLCRVGKNLGLSAIISRREADRKGINYLYPSEWKEYGVETGIFVYPNNEVRDAKGKFLGTYLGQQGDHYSPYPLWGAQKIFFKQNKAIYSLDVEGNLQQTTAEEVVSSRIGWDTSKKITGVEEPATEAIAEIISALAKQHPEALKAALQLQEICQFNPPTPEELERRAQQKRSQRCHRLAYDYLLQLSDNCPVAEDCDSLWFRLSEMTDEELDRFERGEMSAEELHWFPIAEKEPSHKKRCSTAVDKEAVRAIFVNDEEEE